jgi:hypothetical protein
MAWLPAMGWSSGDDGVVGEAAEVEGQAVLAARPELRDRGLMLLRPVALVTLEAVACVALAQASHETIAGRLGHDRGCRDGRAGRVSANDPLVHGRAGAERIAVDETKLRPLSHGAERPLEAGQVGGAKPDPVDLARGDGHKRDRLRVGEDGSREPLARGRREALRVVHLLEEISTRAGGEPLQVEENARGHDRAGPASARPHLVDACDQANATSAVVGKEGRVAHGVRLFNPTESPHQARREERGVDWGTPSR